MDKNQYLEKFILKLSKNTQLLQELQEASTNDPENGAYNFALEHSEGNFSKTEFENCISNLWDKYQKKKQQLDETELQNVAGGAGETTFQTIVNLFGHIVNFIGTCANIRMAHAELKQAEQNRKDNELALKYKKLKELAAIEELRNKLIANGWDEATIDAVLMG